MFPASVRMLVVCALLAATTLPARAQFGLPGIRKLPFSAPGRVLPRVLSPRILPGVLAYGKFRRAFGVVAVVAVGSVILGRLHERDRREVARRAKVTLERDPQDRVVDTYTTKDGSRQVTITAHPTQTVGDIKDDPILKQTTASAQEGATKEQNTDTVKVADLPPDTQCRKVTTEYELKTPPKKNAQTSNTQTGDDKSANTSILCRTSATEWKPAST